MTSQMFVQKCRENIGISTFALVNAIQEVTPSDTIFLSYELYNKMLNHPAFKEYYTKYLNNLESIIETTIPGRVMLLKTGHVIVVVNG